MIATGGGSDHRGTGEVVRISRGGSHALPIEELRNRVLLPEILTDHLNVQQHFEVVDVEASGFPGLLNECSSRRGRRPSYARLRGRANERLYCGFSPGSSGWQRTSAASLVMLERNSTETALRIDPLDKANDHVLARGRKAARRHRRGWARPTRALAGR